MNNLGHKNRGRPCKYVTLERFNEFLINDFAHVRERTKTNTKLLWIIITLLIAAALIDRLFGG